MLLGALLIAIPVLGGLAAFLWKDGKTRPFATVLGWNVRIAGDEDRPGSTGRDLVVTRLNPGGVCQVGFINARTNRNANELAQQLADTKARSFQCGEDKPNWVGNSPL